MINRLNSIETGRRAFLRNGTLILAAGALADPWAMVQDEPNVAVRVGLVTDLHYADKPPAGSRHYRESIAKLSEAANRFAKNKPDLIVELGDLIDAADSVETELAWLETVNRELSAICDDRHYVLGNHCVTTLTKEEFLKGVGREKPHYSFDRGGFHFVVLDACFRADGDPYGRNNFVWTDANIPEEQIDWLRRDLNDTANKTIVLAHQRLDVSNDHGVKNCPQVRTVLEESGKVLAVFQGHSHANDLNEINGIHYCTLVAMVEGSGKENNGYALMELEENGTIRLTGFRKQASHDWKSGS